MFTIALQRRRLQSIEPEDERFPFRPWADLEFLIMELRRLRRSAQLAARAPAIESKVRLAIADFDLAVPGLLVMRNVGEHLEDYGVDAINRHIKTVDRKQLEVSSWDGVTFKWLGRELDVDAAMRASSARFHGLKAAASTQWPPKRPLARPTPTAAAVSMAALMA